MSDRWTWGRGELGAGVPQGRGRQNTLQGKHSLYTHEIKGMVEWRIIDCHEILPYHDEIANPCFVKLTCFIIVNFIIRETNGEKHFDQTLFGGLHQLTLSDRDRCASRYLMIDPDKVWSKCFSLPVSRNYVIYNNRYSNLPTHRVFSTYRVMTPLHATGCCDHLRAV